MVGPPCAQVDEANAKGAMKYCDVTFPLTGRSDGAIRLAAPGRLAGRALLDTDNTLRGTP